MKQHKIQTVVRLSLKSSHNYMALHDYDTIPIPREVKQSHRLSHALMGLNPTLTQPNKYLMRRICERAPSHPATPTPQPAPTQDPSVPWLPSLDSMHAPR